MVCLFSDFVPELRRIWFRFRQFCLWISKTIIKLSNQMSCLIILLFRFSKHHLRFLCLKLFQIMISLKIWIWFNKSFLAPSNSCIVVFILPTVDSSSTILLEFSPSYTSSLVSSFHSVYIFQSILVIHIYVWFSLNLELLKIHSASSMEVLYSTLSILLLPKIIWNSSHIIKYHIEIILS